MNKTIFPNATELIESLVKYVQSDFKNDYLRTDFGIIDNELAAIIYLSASFKLENYALSINAHGIRHVLNQHGTVYTELSRGQLAVEIEDWLQLPHIIEYADFIADSQKSKLGNDCILFEKQIGEKRYFSI
jgi:phage-Barnase-EndoU-ColicinE5/D-RelE like nuclease3